MNSMNMTHFGMDDIEDFGTINSSNNLSYTDYKKAHIDENLLIDVSKVKYNSYNSVEQLESARSNLTYTLSNEDKKRYDNLELQKQENMNLKMQQQLKYDEMVKNQYEKINRRLIIHNK